MRPDSFRVVFQGEVLKGADPTQVKINIAKLFGLDPDQPGNLEKLQRLFSGKPVIIKDNLSLEQVEQYRNAIKQAGAACRIQINPLDEQRKIQRRTQGERRAQRRTSSILPDRRNQERRQNNFDPDD